MCGVGTVTFCWDGCLPRMGGVYLIWVAQEGDTYELNGVCKAKVGREEEGRER
jgi:hypothetical protein